MQAAQVTTTAAEIVPGGNRDFVHIYNLSDTTIYVKYDGDATALTTSNGMPILPNDVLILANDGNRTVYTRAIWAIHGGSGNKEVRIQGA